VKFLTNLSLWTKITILTTVGLALCIIVFSILGLRAVNEATDAMLQDRLTTASLIADFIDESLSRASSQLQRSSQLIDNNASPDYKTIASDLDNAYDQLSIHLYGVYVVDAAGKSIYFQSESQGSYDLDLLLFPETYTMTPEQFPYVTRAVPVGPSSTPVVFLMNPVKLPDSGGTGWMAVAIDLAQSNIGIFIRPLKLGQTGYVEVVDQSGVVISRTEPGPKLQPFEKSDHSDRFAALINAGKPTQGVCHTCHLPTQRVSQDVLAFVPMTEAHWGVVVRQSEAEAMAPAHKLSQNLYLYGLGIVVVALLFVVLTVRNVGGRIKTLTVASRRIAGGDLSSPVEVGGKDEIGVLARTFDDMRGKLNTSYGELEQKTQELSSLLSVSGILTSNQELPDLFKAVVTKAVEVISVADGGILLLEKKDHSGLEVQCTMGLEPGVISRILPAAGIPPIEDPEKRVQRVITALNEAEFLRGKIRSQIYAEVIHRNQFAGVLVLVSFRSPEAFTASDKRIVRAIADDISIAIERHELAQEADEARALHEADRLRSEFVSSVSHELRTPLTIIKGYATSLLRKNVEWDEATKLEFLKSIDEKTDELRDLIDKILLSAKLEAGALKIEKEPLLIAQIARKVVEDNARWSQNHHFRIEFPASFPVVEADPRCIEQVIRNLAENAVKYSPNGGEISIAGEVEGEEIIVTVKDQGVGIPVQYQGKIFERFFRVGSPLTRGTTGSGLGLSICKGNIKAHGGRIWFESEAGKGTAFHFSLPVAGVEPDEL
jgi:signal transduction histidine kinase/HAMP domain-containing protein